jgi:hypothetical protein
VQEIHQQVGDQGTILKLQIESNIDAAKEWDVTLLPTFIYFENGQEVRRANTITHPQNVAEWLMVR